MPGAQEPALSEAEGREGLGPGIAKINIRIDLVRSLGQPVEVNCLFARVQDQKNSADP